MQDFFSADTLAFIAAHQDDDVAKLALKFSSRKDIDIRAALQQIEGRQIAKSKLPSFANAENIVYPVKLSMEQCSSEKTALYKQSVAGDGASMIDLTVVLEWLHLADSAVAVICCFTTSFLAISKRRNTWNEMLTSAE